MISSTGAFESVISAGSSCEMARLTPFEIGQIKAHAEHDLSAPSIAARVIKSDGQPVGRQAVLDVLARLHADPKWRGERAEGSGRKRKTSPALDKAIVNEVLQKRAAVKVGVKFLKKRFPALRSLSKTLVEERLHEAGLEYLRRRRKTLVPKEHKKTRLAFAKRVLTLRTPSLSRWAYSDGTVFFLDRTDADAESSKRASLGRYVWRRADRTDALYEECVGPSSYKKGQGTPVRVWGLLTNGKLNITILPRGERVNRWWYAWIVQRYFPQWLDGCNQIIQDYEACLRCTEPLDEFRKLNVQVVKDYPKCSQDLNAIENAWKLLRDRLDQTQPAQMESREDFVARLRNAVRWVNENCYDQLLHFCTNQKERAAEVVDLKGGRTSW